MSSPIKVRSIVDQVLSIMMQGGQGRWTEYDLVSFLSEAQSFVVQQKPDSHYEVALLKLKRGALQTIPQNGYAFIDATEVREGVVAVPDDVVDLTTDPAAGGGTVEGIVLKESAYVMDNLNPKWRVPALDVRPQQYITREMMRAHFEVNPPHHGGTERWVRVTYSAVPTPIEERPNMFAAADAAGKRAAGAAYADALLDLDATYQYALRCFVLAEAYARQNIGELGMSETWRIKCFDALQLGHTGIASVQRGQERVNTPMEPP